VAGDSDNDNGSGSDSGNEGEGEDSRTNTNSRKAKAKAIVTPGDLRKQKFKQMSAALCDFMNDFGLVSFTAMNIEDVETVGRVLAAVDRANGYR
jgi:hypothetical protein